MALEWGDVDLSKRPRAIQELARHVDVSTTQRYMHLSPAAIEGAIRLLDLQATPRAGVSETSFWRRQTGSHYSSATA